MNILITRRRFLSAAALAAAGRATAGPGFFGASGQVVGGAWTPLSLGSTLKRWYKADSLALSNGVSVSTWSDSSGSGDSGSQTGTARPTFVTSWNNGLPAVQFVAASFQYMPLANPVAISGDITLFLVATFPLNLRVNLFGGNNCYIGISNLCNWFAVDDLGVQANPACCGPCNMDGIAEFRRVSGAWSGRYSSSGSYYSFGTAAGQMTFHNIGLGVLSLIHI